MYIFSSCFEIGQIANLRRNFLIKQCFFFYLREERGSKFELHISFSFFFFQIMLGLHLEVQVPLASKVKQNNTFNIFEY